MPLAFFIKKRTRDLGSHLLIENISAWGYKSQAFLFFFLK